MFHTVQLLKDFSIKAAGGSVKLLKVIKNPITDHLPPGCLKITTSFAAEETLNPADLSKDDMPIVFVVGAFAKGSVRNFFLNLIMMPIIKDLLYCYLCFFSY